MPSLSKAPVIPGINRPNVPQAPILPGISNLS